MRAPVLATLTLLASLAAACGGSNASDAPKTPASEPSAPNSAPDNHAAGAPAASGSAAANAPAGPPTTTTSTLSSNGDLTGAKLSSSSTTTVETKGTNGPRPSGEGELGRRREDIQVIIGSRRDEARKCYDDGLKRNPGLEGDLDIKWTIDPKGNVTDISVDDSKSQIHDDLVGKCIIGIIQKIKFAESAKGFETRMHYPFNFHPHGQQQRGAAVKN